MKDLILVTGSEGLVGSRFTELFPQKHVLHTPRRIEFDITNTSEIKALMKSYEFKTVVNFAAYTDVGEAENERDDKDGTCWQVNVVGVRNLVGAIDPYKTHFIQVSTDMVFTGTREDPGPYLENHPIETDSSKLTWYGYTKAEAERVVQEIIGKNATILRINYPVRAKFENKLDYLRKHLKLYDEGKLYPLFSNEQFAITFIDEACQTLEKIITNKERGIFHPSSKDTVTAYELISYMLEEARGVKGVVESTTLEEFTQKGNDPRRYPKFGGLSVDITERKLGIKFSSWRQIVDKLVSQGLGQ